MNFVWQGIQICDDFAIGFSGRSTAFKIQKQVIFMQISAPPHFLGLMLSFPRKALTTHV